MIILHCMSVRDSESFMRRIGKIPRRLVGRRRSVVHSVTGARIDSHVWAEPVLLAGASALCCLRCTVYQIQLTATRSRRGHVNNTLLQ